MIKIVCDRCGREVHMKNPDLTGRAKIGFEEYDLCKYCVLDIKRYINQGREDRKTEPKTDKHKCRRCVYYDIPSDYYPCVSCVDYSNYTGEIEDEPQTEREGE